jgi:hypothetical protein
MRRQNVRLKSPKSLHLATVRGDWHATVDPMQSMADQRCGVEAKVPGNDRLSDQVRLGTGRSSGASWRTKSGILRLAILTVGGGEVAGATQGRQTSSQ